jgi:creatinine amidohydrolase
MPDLATSRMLAALSSPEAAARVSERSILCLPLGAIEQHGPHLPLNTDAIIAEGLARRLVARWGEEFDLWQLPTLAIGLSREHDWAPGTLTLSIAGFTSLLRGMAGGLARGLAARNLVLLNGHGGNRGVLEVLLHELSGDFELNCCVIHPFDLATNESDPVGADVHGGMSETSVMLALAPELVRREPIGRSGPLPDPAAVRALIFDRGASFPWRTDDPRLARDGIVGNPEGATAEHGEALIARMLACAGGVFARLLENQKIMRALQRPPA